MVYDKFGDCENDLVVCIVDVVWCVCYVVEVEDDGVVEFINDLSVV